MDSKERIGILDPDGKNINPLNNNPYSEDYKKLASVWRKFPGYEMADEIIDAIKENQVVLIVAETGSGKTVLVPKYALHAFDYKSKIGVTLPKQVTAQSAAEFGAKTLDVKLGEQVGYQYKGSPKDSKSSQTLLLYATDGTITSKLLKNPSLDEFNCIIIDEAHERKVQIDFLVYLLRETLKLRPDFRLVIMSATVNADIFRNYYSNNSFKEINIGGKRNFPIESIFLQNPLEYNAILNKGFEILTNILDSDNPSETSRAHDLLFFVTSSNEAFELCRKLQNYINTTCKNSKISIICKNNTFCVEFYSGMESKKQTLAQDKDLYKINTKYNRKVVISTNVAESSLTIDGIKYVIDSGYELKGSYDPVTRARRLDRQLITQAQAKQRMGRSGRTEPGVCYHLYTNDDFNRMEKYPEPDIRVSDISNECLSLLNIKTIDTIPNLINVLTQFLEPPKSAYIKDAVVILMQQGLVKDDKITELGKTVVDVMSTGITDLSAAIALIYSKLYNCSHEMLKILTMIDVCKNNIGSLFIIPKMEQFENRDKYNKKMDEFDKNKKKFKHKYGDHLSLLNIYTAYHENYIKHKDSVKISDILDRWCSDRFLRLKILMKATEHIKKTKDNLRRIKLDNLGDSIIVKDESVLSFDVDDRVMYCLMKGYQINKATKYGINYTTNYSSNLKIEIDRNSFLHYNKGVIKDVFYVELFVSSGKANLNIVSKFI